GCIPSPRRRRPRALHFAPQSRGDKGAVLQYFAGYFVDWFLWGLFFALFSGYYVCWFAWGLCLALCSGRLKHGRHELNQHTVELARCLHLRPVPRARDDYQLAPRNRFMHVSRRPQERLVLLPTDDFCAG